MDVKPHAIAVAESEQYGSDTHSNTNKLSSITVQQQLAHAMISIVATLYIIPMFNRCLLCPFPFARHTAVSDQPAPVAINARKIPVRVLGAWYLETRTIAPAAMFRPPRDGPKVAISGLVRGRPKTGTAAR
jgi:hypothetical protein